VSRRTVAAALLVLAACSGAGVTTGSAVTTSSTSTTSTSTSTTTTTTTAPSTTTAPPTTAPPTAVAGDPDQPSLGVGDRLFPELGSADLDVQSYDLQVRYLAPPRFDATVTITTLVDRPLDVLALDARQLTVDGVTVDGAAATFEQTSSDLLVHAPTRVEPGRPVIVAVTYHDDQHGAVGGFQLGPGWMPTAGGSYVLDEPDGARNWLPSNDTPGDKSTWRFRITVPQGVTAVANGHLVGQEPGPDGTTWVWDEPVPMATYMVQLLTGDYEIVEGGTVGTTRLTNVALRTDRDRAAPYFDRTAEQLAFFEGLFGPYPFDHYGVAFTDSPPGLAMETLGRSMFADGDFRGPVDEQTEMLQSHELAHQWFGDAVTPARWEDLWLNESFATYGQWLWLDHAGYQPIDAAAEDALRRRQAPGEPTAAPSSGGLFGFERYEGGAVVLHALRREIGDDAFFILLRRWVADNTGTSRTTADFTALASQVAGRDLTAFFGAWLYAAAVPGVFPG
jgi:aminopeptidase N